MVHDFASCYGIERWRFGLKDAQKFSRRTLIVGLRSRNSRFVLQGPMPESPTPRERATAVQGGLLTCGCFNLSTMWASQNQKRHCTIVIDGSFGQMLPPELILARVVFASSGLIAVGKLAKRCCDNVIVVGNRKCRDSSFSATFCVLPIVGTAMLLRDLLCVLLSLAGRGPLLHQAQ